MQIRFFQVSSYSHMILNIMTYGFHYSDLIIQNKQKNYKFYHLWLNLYNTLTLKSKRNSQSTPKKKRQMKEEECLAILYKNIYTKMFLLSNAITCILTIMQKAPRENINIASSIWDLLQ